MLRLKKIKMAKILGIIAIITVIGFLGTSNSVQAKNLRENKTYSVNIDGKKGKEKICIKSKLDKDEHYYTFSLYINGKKVAKQRGLSIICKVVDINKKAKGKDIVFYATTESMCLANKAGIFSYKNGKLNRLLDICNIYDGLYIYRINGISTNGKGKVTIAADTPALHIGSYYAKIDFKLKSGKLVNTTKDGFDFCKISRKYQYVLNQKEKLYGKADSTSVEKATLNKKTKVQILKVRYKATISGEDTNYTDIYAYVKDKKGNKGWIVLREIDYSDWKGTGNQFKEYPAWG